MSLPGNGNFDSFYNAPGNSMNWTGLPNQRSANTMPAPGFSPVHGQRQVAYNVPGNSTGNAPGMGYNSYPAQSLPGNGTPMPNYNALRNSADPMFPLQNLSGFDNPLPGQQALSTGYDAFGNTTTNAYPAPRREMQAPPPQLPVYNNYGNMSVSQGHGAQGFARGNGAGWHMGMPVQAQRPTMYQAPAQQNGSQGPTGQSGIYNGAGMPMSQPLQPQRSAFPVQGQHFSSPRSMMPVSAYGAPGMTMGSPQRAFGQAVPQHAVSQRPMYPAAGPGAQDMSMAQPASPPRERTRQVPKAGDVVISLDDEEEVPASSASGTSSDTVSPPKEKPKKKGPIDPYGLRGDVYMKHFVSDATRDILEEEEKQKTEAEGVSVEGMKARDRAVNQQIAEEKQAKESQKPKKAAEPKKNASSASKKRKTANDDNVSPRQPAKRSKKSAPDTTASNPPAIAPAVLPTAPPCDSPVDDMQTLLEQEFAKLEQDRSSSLNGAQASETVPGATGNTAANVAAPLESVVAAKAPLDKTEAAKAPVGCKRCASGGRACPDCALSCAINAHQDRLKAERELKARAKAVAFAAAEVAAAKAAAAAARESEDAAESGEIDAALGFELFGEDV